MSTGAPFPLCGAICTVAGISHPCGRPRTHPGDHSCGEKCSSDPAVTWPQVPDEEPPTTDARRAPTEQWDGVDRRAICAVELVVLDDTPRERVVCRLTPGHEGHHFSGIIAWARDPIAEFEWETDDKRLALLREIRECVHRFVEQLDRNIADYQREREALHARGDT